MKRFIRYIGIVVAVAVLLAIPIHVNAAETRASAYFWAYDSYLWRTSGTTFEVWFEVHGCELMDELGVNSIQVQRSVDGKTWITMRTYLPEDYPQMICEDTGSHVGCITYTGVAGCYYRARVTFYAKNSSGTGMRVDYAETILL